MAILSYGISFTCDACRVQGQIPDHYPAPRYDALPMPDGWVDLGLFSLVMTDAYGAAIRQLCQVCGSLSIGGLLERLKARVASEQHRMLQDLQVLLILIRGRHGQHNGYPGVGAGHRPRGRA